MLSWLLDLSESGPPGDMHPSSVDDADLHVCRAPTGELVWALAVAPDGINKGKIVLKRIE